MIFFKKVFFLFLIVVFFSNYSSAKLFKKTSVTMGEHYPVVMSLVSYKSKFGERYQIEKKVDEKKLFILKLPQQKYSVQLNLIQSLHKKLFKYKIEITSNCSEKVQIDIDQSSDLYCLDSVSRALRKDLMSWWRELDKF